jgi:peptide/nickel transport system permease protein
MKITLANQNRALLLWGCILTLVMILSTAAPLFAHCDPLAVDLQNVFTAPNLQHPFGTDSMGRDIFARILYGGRVSLMVSFLAVLISTMVGIVFGGISGYLGGWADSLMMRLLDAFLAIPALIIMLALQAVIKGGVFSMILIIGFTGWMTMARIVRSQFQALKEKGFVKAAVILHTPAWKIAVQHLLRNSLSSIIVIAIFNCAQAIFTEVSLSFLGLGVPPQIPSWGNMLNNAQNDILIGAWWVGLFPGAMIVISLLGINFFGEALKKKYCHTSNFGGKTDGIGD